MFDVAGDLSADSETYGKYYGVELTEENIKRFLVPKIFVYGFLVLSDVSEFCYKCDYFYYQNDEGGLAWNAPAIGLEWLTLVGIYHGTASEEEYILKDGKNKLKR